MSDDKELKACPCCGGEDIANVFIRDGRKIACTNSDCFCSVSAYQPNATEKAIAAWNQRQGSEPQLISYHPDLYTCTLKHKGREYYFDLHHAKKTPAPDTQDGG